MKGLAAAVGVILSVAWAGVSQATLIEVRSSAYAGFLPSTELGSRGIGFRADQDFSISSLGIYGDILGTDYTVAVRSSTSGNNAGAILASNTAASGGVGIGWQDIGLNYSFSAGSFYTIQWGPSASVDWILGGVDFYFDAALPEVVGDITLINGYRTISSPDGIGSFGNTVNARLRVNVVSNVPVAATFALLGLGVAGIGYTRKRGTRTRH